MTRKTFFMDAITTEIEQLLLMIPYLDANERTELLAKLPGFSLARQESIRRELWETIKHLIASIPLPAFLEADFSEEEKEKILRIEEKYLHDLREIEREMHQEFLAHEQTIKQRDEEHANALLLKLV